MVIPRFSFLRTHKCIPGTNCHYMPQFLNLEKQEKVYNHKNSNLSSTNPLCADVHLFEKISTNVCAAHSPDAQSHIVIDFCEMCLFS